MFLGDSYRDCDTISVIVPSRFQFCAQLITEGDNFRRRDPAVGLTAEDVQEHPGVVAALRPSSRACPIDQRVAQRRGRGGWLSKHEVSLPDQPLVDTEPAMHRASAVVAHHQECRVVVGQVAQPPDVSVQQSIVLAPEVLPSVAGFVSRVLGIDVAPERVMKSV